MPAGGPTSHASTRPAKARGRERVLVQARGQGRRTAVETGASARSLLSALPQIRGSSARRAVLPAPPRASPRLGPPLATRVLRAASCRPGAQSRRASREASRSACRTDLEMPPQGAHRVGGRSSCATSRAMARVAAAALCCALLVACAVQRAEAFRPPCVVPAGRRELRGLAMTQPPPPAKMELPAAKLQAAAVNAKQWGTDTAGAGGDALPPPRGGEAARSSALEFAASYAGIGQRIAIVGFSLNALYLIYLLQAGK